MPQWLTLCLVFIAFSATSLLAAEDRYPTFTSIEEAGADFLVQGEYVGLAGGVLPIAVQVIALGEEEFEGVMFQGGLPGAGWDGKQRQYFQGKTTDGKTEFFGKYGYKLAEKNEYWQAIIENRVMRGSDQSLRNQLNDVSFVLHKVQRESPTLGDQPPEGATVLFDGTNTEAWGDAKIVEHDLLDRGAKTRQSFQDYQLHLEFRTPFMPTARGMHRGNSGIFIRNKYEIQIVDSFGWTIINRRFERNSWVGRCGGIEEILPPDVNLTYPPLSWQTYDVDYSMPRHDKTGQQISPPMMSVRLNGVLIHNRRVLPPESEVRDDREPGPLYLQDHHDQVVFRNIWVVEAQ
ncbi:3-keto-disaccharide hydrolase [Bythopirellula polymerisocia]|uniref:3-keto-alpha-glucoside-1,2-lyase/3-keto-2-hydroxy-glucal hydratase domain-containing protein n=1 Tax=Bythopirellula polymerisocia TaxID=2528003 RepID=A0A5C6CVF7_9BACT|nr:DUF1080 domain-containing protein [Bythopirellula polymerisocia]TWU27497.1 hypothetical protein Pla144_22710 [Bythopirellula polymerisocia]